MGNGVHESHDDIAKRFKRAKGHLGKVISMIEEGESCVDVARQLQGVYKVVYNAKQLLIRDHVDHCLSVKAIEERPVAEVKAEPAEITCIVDMACCANDSPAAPM